MPPLNPDLYNIAEYDWDRSEVSRKHTRSDGLIFYAKSREAKDVDEILNLVSSHLNMRFGKCTTCDTMYDMEENTRAEGGQCAWSGQICNKDICQTCPSCKRCRFILCECEKRRFMGDGSS